MPVGSPSLVVLNIFHNRSRDQLEEAKSVRHSRAGSDSQSLGSWIDEEQQQAERISMNYHVSLLSETRREVIRYRENAPKILNVSDANTSNRGIACAPSPSQVDWSLKFYNLETPFNTWDFWSQHCNVVKYGLTWDAACLYIRKFKSNPERLMALKTTNPADLHLESWEIEAMAYGLTRTEVIDVYGLKYFKTHLKGMKTCGVLKFANHAYPASLIMKCLDDGIKEDQIISMISLGLTPEQIKDPRFNTVAFQEYIKAHHENSSAAYEAIKDLNLQQIAAMTLGLTKEEVGCSNFTGPAAIRTVAYLEKHRHDVHQAMKDIIDLNEYQIELFDQRLLTVEQLKKNHNDWSIKAIIDLNLKPLLVYINPIVKTEDYLAMKAEKKKLDQFVVAAQKEKSYSWRDRFFSKMSCATLSVREEPHLSDDTTPARLALSG